MNGLENDIHRKTWNRDEFAKLHDAFPEERCELIEGDLLDKKGQSPPHACVVALLAAILTKQYPGRIRVQSPISLPDPEGLRSAPQPDVVVLHQHNPEFYYRHPNPSDIALVIEVSDATLHMDRNIKGPLYSRSGIPAYWIVDLQSRRILTFENPGFTEYKANRIYEHDESVVMQGDPAFSIAANGLFSGVEKRA